MSYDPVDVLSDFAHEHGITYPLLSDVGSQAIKRLGLLDPDIERQHAHFGFETTERHQGLPYPGNFHLDADGVILDKQFEQSHRVRPSGAILLHDEIARVEPQCIERTAVGSVSIEVSLLSATYYPEQQQRLAIRLAIPPGDHVYVGTVPRGFTSLTVEVAGPPGLVVDEPDMPAGEPLRIDALNLDFEVVTGQVELALPLRITKDEGDCDLNVSVSLQSCTTDACFPPGTANATLRLHGGGLVRH